MFCIVTLRSLKTYGYFPLTFKYSIPLFLQNIKRLLETQVHLHPSFKYNRIISRIMRSLIFTLINFNLLPAQSVRSGGRNLKTS